MKTRYFLILGFAFTALFLTYSCTKDNELPTTPLLYFPADNDTEITAMPTLIWTACPDPENDQVLYDIYLGLTNPPGLVKSDQPLNNFKTDTLAGYSTYYWKVVAKDGNNGKSSSEIWQFKTGMSVISPGNLKVLLCNSTQTTYYGGREVYLYKTEADRRNDTLRVKYFQKATSDNQDPSGIGAMFYALSFRNCYVYSRVDIGGGNYLYGSGEGTVISGSTATLVVMVK